MDILGDSERVGVFLLLEISLYGVEYVYNYGMFNMFIVIFFRIVIISVVVWSLGIE